MKDYSIGESKKNYILRIEENEANGTFDVVFADGSRFTDVEANEANIQKVIAIQEKQAKDGVANKAVFVGKRTKAGVLTGFSAAASLAAATAISSIPAVEQMVAGQNPVVVAVGIACLTIAIGCAVNGVSFGQQIVDWFGTSTKATGDAIQEVVSTTACKLIA